MGVTLNHLVPMMYATPDLFVFDKNRQQLNHIVDELNTRYGSNTVYYGGAHRARHAAPMRIAFTQIPDVQRER